MKARTLPASGLFSYVGRTSTTRKSQAHGSFLYVDHVTYVRPTACGGCCWRRRRNRPAPRGDKRGPDSSEGIYARPRLTQKCQGAFGDLRRNLGYPKVPAICGMHTIKHHISLQRSLLSPGNLADPP